MDCVAAATAGLISLKFRQFQRLSRPHLLSVKQRPVTMRTCASGPRVFGGRHGATRLGKHSCAQAARSDFWSIATAQANAGGLAVREQSVYGQGVVLRRHRCRWSALFDVLESGDHDAVLRHCQRNRCVRYLSLCKSHADVWYFERSSAAHQTSETPCPFPQAIRPIS